MLRLCWEPKSEIRSQDEAASSTVGNNRDCVIPGIGGLLGSSPRFAFRASCSYRFGLRSWFTFLPRND